MLLYARKVCRSLFRHEYILTLWGRSYVWPWSWHLGVNNPSLSFWTLIRPGLPFEIRSFQNHQCLAAIKYHIFHIFGPRYIYIWIQHYLRSWWTHDHARQLRKRFICRRLAINLPQSVFMFASQSLLRIYVCSRFVYGFYGWHVQIALFDLLRLERICPVETKDRRSPQKIGT